MSTRDPISTNRSNRIDASQLVSVTQAANALGCSQRLIYKLIRDGVIRVFGTPKTYRVLLNEVLADHRGTYNYLGQMKDKRGLSSTPTASIDNEDK